MGKLLALVERRVTLLNTDITLKFTLSALWNLTDESPDTCQVFLNLGGLQLYRKVLVEFCDEIQVMRVKF